MTGGLLISLYLFTLAGFLGLDVIRKVPPTLYGALATGMGVAAALVVVVSLSATSESSSGSTASLSTMAIVLSAAGVVGGLFRVRRMLRQRGNKP